MLATLDAVALTQATEFVFVSLEEVRTLNGSFLINALLSFLGFSASRPTVQTHVHAPRLPRFNHASIALTVSVVSQHSRTGPPPAHDVIDDAREFDAELAWY